MITRHSSYHLSLEHTLEFCKYLMSHSINAWNLVWLVLINYTFPGEQCWVWRTAVRITRYPCKAACFMHIETTTACLQADHVLCVFCFFTILKQQFSCTGKTSTTFFEIIKRLFCSMVSYWSGWTIQPKYNVAARVSIHQNWQVSLLHQQSFVSYCFDRTLFECG